MKNSKTLSTHNVKQFKRWGFFDGVLAIVESKYLEKEKNQIIAAYDQDLYGGLNGSRKYNDGEEYYEHTFNKN